MELLDLQPYLLFMLAGASLITAIITGGKYFHRRYTDSLDKRIDGCIKTEIIKNTRRIKKLERKIDLMVRIIVPVRKRELFNSVDMDNDE